MWKNESIHTNTLHSKHSKEWATAPRTLRCTLCNLQHSSNANNKKPPHKPTPMYKHTTTATRQPASPHEPSMATKTSEYLSSKQHPTRSTLHHRAKSSRNQQKGHPAVHTHNGCENAASVHAHLTNDNQQGKPWKPAPRHLASLHTCPQATQRRLPRSTRSTRVVSS